MAASFSPPDFASNSLSSQSASNASLNNQSASSSLTGLEDIALPPPPPPPLELEKWQKWSSSQHDRNWSRNQNSGTPGKRSIFTRFPQSAVPLQPELPANPEQSGTNSKQSCESICSLEPDGDSRTSSSSDVTVISKKSRFFADKVSEILTAYPSKLFSAIQSY